MASQHFFRRYFLITLALGLLAAALRYWLGPEWASLPADYASETRYAVEDRFRETPDGQWEATTLIGRRVDQTIVAAGETVIVQGDLH